MIDRQTGRLDRSSVKNDLVFDFMWSLQQLELVSSIYCCANVNRKDNKSYVTLYDHPQGANILIMAPYRYTIHLKNWWAHCKKERHNR